MNRDRMHGNKWLTVAAIGAALAMVWVIAHPPTADASTISKKLKRQMNVMEEVIDEILVESPYLLVYSSDPTSGIYLDEFGALFGFEASLVKGDGDWSKGLMFLDKLHIEKDDGKTVIWIEEDDEGEKKIEIVGESEDTDDEGKKVDWEEMREKRQEKEEECYIKGKDELIEGLVDYGETLTGLRDDQWVAIAALLKNADLFKRNEISRLILKVSVRDLRAHADDRISRDELLQRVGIEEY